MPAVSKAQQRLMQAAEHGADFLEARKLRRTMTRAQMHDFAVGSEQGKPDHVPHPARNLGPHLKAAHGGVIVTNHHRGATRRKG